MGACDYGHMTSSEQDTTIAEGLALAATMCFEMGDDLDLSRDKVLGLWEQVGTPAGAFQAAADAIDLLPEPKFWPADSTEHAWGARDESGVQSPEHQRDAALKARELLQALASEHPQR